MEDVLYWQVEKQSGLAKLSDRHFEILILVF